MDNISKRRLASYSALPIGYMFFYFGKPNIGLPFMIFAVLCLLLNVIEAIRRK